MDKIDRDIIRALDKNARYSATKISTMIGESKQRVAFRIRKMIERGILDLFSAIINKSKLGYFHCQIYLRFQREWSEQLVCDRLKKIPSLHWEGVALGDYHLVIFFLAGSLHECWQVYSQIIRRFSGGIIKKEIILTSKTHYLNHAYITHSREKESISEFPCQKTKIKQGHLNLINALKEHGRIQINALAKKVNATPYTVRQRIAYLERIGIITCFRIRINHSALGFKHYMFLIDLGGIADKRKEKLIESLIQKNEAIRITETIGKWDLICDLVLQPGEKYVKAAREDLLAEGIHESCIQILEIKKVLPINTVVYRSLK